MGDAKYRSSRFVGHALDLPTMRQNNLLDDGQAESGAGLLSRKIRLEDLRALIESHSRSVVTDLKSRFRGISLQRQYLYFATVIGGLDCIKQKIEKRLPQELLVCFDGERFAFHLYPDVFLFQIVVQSMDDFLDYRGQGKR